MGTVKVRIGFCFSVALAASAIAADPSLISLELEKTEAKFVVDKLPGSILGDSAQRTDEEWQKLFAVYTVNGDQPAPVPLLGDYTVVNQKLIFAPRYPLRRGVTYRAILRGAGNSAVGRDSRDFKIPAEPAGPAPQLTAIFPTRDVVPENLLKLYLHFSAPMSRGEVYQRVRLIDQKGNVVEHPFLELSEELWSPDGKRLTVYFDPGRIKRGLKPRELFGPALLEGGSYTLEFDGGWPDADGRPLKSSVKKQFRVVAPDDQQPDVKQWKLSAPRAHSRMPLTITFNEPLDSAMLERVVSIQDANGKPVQGTITIAKQETLWTFEPAMEWTPGKFAVVVATTLEDLAGNSLGRPFEVDIFRPAPNRLDDPTVAIPFEVN